MKKYINNIRHRVYNAYKKSEGILCAWHGKLLVQGYYKIIFHELFTILLTGVLISIAMVPIFSFWKPWLSFSYGLIPWLAVQLAVYAKRELK